MSTLGKYQSKFFNSSLNQFLEKELNHDEKMCLIAPEYFDSEICELRIDLDNFLSNIQKIDSPENSLGLSNPINLSTVGATSFNANLDSIS